MERYRCVCSYFLCFLAYLTRYKYVHFVTYFDSGDLYSEIAIMDFVWDADHNILRKTAWWWDPACYYCLPSTTEEIFLDVPPATLGSFRLSYANIHTADEFTNRMDLVVSAGSDWLSLNPSIDVYMEWTGAPYIRLGTISDAPTESFACNFKPIFRSVGRLLC